VTTETVAPTPAQRPLRSAIVLTGATLLLISIVRTAWLSDDAFITFRTLDNIVHGYGPVWNAGERVQSYTHPLWAALFLPVYAVTRNPYWSIPLQWLLTLTAVAIVVLRVAETQYQRLVVFAALLSSKAFIDFSTSGLENPLAYTVLALFLWRWWEDPAGESRIRRLALLGSLCVLTRPDLAVLVWPAVAVDSLKVRPRAALRSIALGLLPLIGWELFSLVYYGFPASNTAYAKLNTGIPGEVLRELGVRYFKRTFRGDPLTLPVMALAPFAILPSRWRRDWPLAVGVWLFCAYVLSIGGDFMMSRFFTAPFFVSVALLARARWLRARLPGAIAATAFVVIGLLAPWEPALLSGHGYSRVNNFLHGDGSREPRDKYVNLTIDGVTDERRFYDNTTTLLKTHGIITHDWAEVGRLLRQQGRPVFEYGTIGFTGYFAGPDVHIIDQFALAEPLLARLPAWRVSRIGHFRRDIPAGYEETVASGHNCIANPEIAAYYDRLHLIIAGPLWSQERFAAIVGMLLGRYPAPHVTPGA
jgi:arabinofuranosyltransferase